MAACPLQFEGLREHRGRVSEVLGEDLRDGASVFAGLDDSLKCSISHIINKHKAKHKFGEQEAQRVCVCVHKRVTVNVSR